MFVERKWDRIPLKVVVYGISGTGGWSDTHKPDQLSIFNGRDINACEFGSIWQNAGGAKSELPQLFGINVVPNTVDVGVVRCE